MKKRYEFIDVLKGVAILGIVLVHSVSSTEHALIPSFLSSIIYSGGRGVQLFFIISGYLTFLSLSKNNDKIEFYKKRLKRMIPLFFLIITYYVITNIRNNIGNPISLPHILSLYTLTFGLFPNYINSLMSIEWFVGTLTLMYLISPFLYKYLRNINNSILAFTINFALIQTLRPYLHQLSPISDLGIWKLFIYLFLPSQLPFYLLGIILFYILKSDKKAKRKNYDLLISSVIFSGYLMTIVDNVYLTGISLLFLTYSASRVYIPKIILKLTSPIGKNSYFIYLTHLLLLSFVNRLIFNRLEITGLSIIALRLFITFVLYFVLFTGYKYLIKVITSSKIKI